MLMKSLLHISVNMSFKHPSHAVVFVKGRRISFDIFTSFYIQKGSCNCGLPFGGQFLWHAKYSLPPSRLFRTIKRRIKKGCKLNCQVLLLLLGNLQYTQLHHQRQKKWLLPLCKMRTFIDYEFSLLYTTLACNTS